MKMKAHNNPNNAKWIISLVVMLIIGIITVVASIGITKAVENSQSGKELDITVASTSTLAVKENEYNVTSVSKGLDSKGEVVAYVVETSTIGFNQEVPIVIETTLTADASAIVGIKVIEQGESEYYGVRILTDEFQNQFKGIKTPVVSSKSIEKGGKVDLLSKSTMTSNAVLEGINGATKYVQELVIAE